MEHPEQRNTEPGTVVCRWWVFAVVALLAAFLIPAYWVALGVPAVGMFHDDGVYLVTAKSLATGHGYRIISLPDEIPQTKYPILFPLVLSWVWRLAPEFPSSLLVLKLVPLTFLLVWLWLVFRLMALEASREVAMICVALSAATTWFVFLGTALLSETLFAALCTACVLVLRRAETASTEGREWIWAALLAGLACLTRTAGVAAVAAGVIFYLRRRRIGRAAGFAAVALAVGAPWLWWLATQHPPETDAYYSAANYGSWNLLSGFFSWDRKVAIAGWNVLLLLRSPLTIAGAGWHWALELLAGMMVLAAGVLWLRPLTIVHIFLGIYTAIVLAWAWPPGRFVVVVYPLVLCAGWQVLRAVLRQFPRQAPRLRTAAMVLLSIVAVQEMRILAAATRATLRTGVVLGQQDAWSDTSEQVGWIRDNTPANAVVLSNLDPLFYMYTGRKTVRGFQADPYRLFYSSEAGNQALGTLDDFRKTIRRDRVTYIVRAANKGFSEAPHLDRLIMDLVRSEPDRIRLVAQGRDARFQIYHVEQPI